MSKCGQAATGSLATASDPKLRCEDAVMQKNYPQLEWTQARVSRFWDWQSQYPEVYFTYLFGAAIVASLKGYLKGRKRILDFGCGVGYLIPHLCAVAPEVYGADPSEESVKRTNERLAGTPSFKGAFLIDDVRARKLSFDAVLCVEVVEHLDDAALHAVLADVRALLAPGGTAIFSTPNDEDLSKSMILCPASGEVFHRWQHVRSWNRDSLPARLRAAGFEIEKVVETNMAVPKINSPVRLAKQMVKRLLQGPYGTPHLVCIARSAK
jgi:2-polyprenyl-3-methyl-5-hydroxy-6-metoxy-1,4-benzoquinol methylase